MQPASSGPSGGKGHAQSESAADLTVQDARDAELLFAEQVKSCLPMHLAQLAVPQLLQEEWESPVVPSSELSSKGGVALVKKQELPQVLRQVGQTTRAVAIVTSQPAHELYLTGAPCTAVWCSLQVPTNTGSNVAYVKRYLIQLGMDKDQVVRMDTRDLVEVRQCISTCRVVIRFDQKGGWDVLNMRAVIVSDFLKSAMPESSFESVVVREDGSASALVLHSEVAKLLRRSGHGHVYVKPHVNELAWQDMEILWLPETITHPEALQLANEDPNCYGLARKQSSEHARFGMRFMKVEHMEARAKTLHLGNLASLGRFKVSAVMEGTSVADLFAMMESISWTLQSVEYIGDGHAIVSSKTCPAKNKYRLKRIDGSVVPMYIHAVNSMGRSLFKSQNIECRRVDAEGEEVHDRQPDLYLQPL